MDDQLSSGRQLLRIRKIIPEAKDAKSFVLEPVNGQPIKYTPGQFLTFVFTKSNGSEERRNYSVSSIPTDDVLMITVKRIPNGEYSRWLIDRAKEGDEMVTIGASGFFTLPENVDVHNQIIFFAAGSGITPVYSLIKTILNKYPSIRVVLIYSNRSPAYAIFSEQLKELKKDFPARFEIEFLFSSAKSVLHKRLGIYLLERFLRQYVKGEISRQLFYLCGPFEYMRMITIVLRNNGIPASHIRREIFNIEKPDRKAEPPDKEPHIITTTIHQKEYQFHTQYPETILQSAKALKIPMPYSCEAGQCGTCAATCVSGKVWMWRNDVLLDDEIAKGRVLTCTGYAVGGDVRLEF